MLQLLTTLTLTVSPLMSIVALLLLLFPNVRTKYQSLYKEFLGERAKDVKEFLAERLEKTKEQKGRSEWLPNDLSEQYNKMISRGFKNSSKYRKILYKHKLKFPLVLTYIPKLYAITISITLFCYFMLSLAPMAVVLFFINTLFLLPQEIAVLLMFEIPERKRHSFGYKDVMEKVTVEKL